MLEYTHEDNLYHHGIKGMRWGIRRYQNSDGSLTPAGRKRYAKLEREEIKRTAKAERKAIKEAAKAANKSRQEELKSVASMKKKSVADMTDDELNAAIKRLETEKRYQDLNPNRVSAGRTFVNEVLAPAAKEAGRTVLRDYLTKQGKSLLGLDKADDDAYTTLKKEVDMLDLKKRYKELKSELKNGSKNSSSVDKLISEYDKYSDEDKNRIKRAAQLAEDLDKIKKKNKNN